MYMDRIEQLSSQSLVTGIDFIYVWPNQTQLDVYFLRDPFGLDTSLENLEKKRVSICSQSAGSRAVSVSDISWEPADNRNVLRITTDAPGDFSLYRIVIDDSRIDPYPYTDECGRRRDEFSFKANCPSPFDCQPRPHE